MLDLASSARPPRYQSAAHDGTSDAARRALEPHVGEYRQAGYTLLRQDAYTVSLAAPARRFSTGTLVFWALVCFPVAIIFAVKRASYQPPRVTLRCTPDGAVEEDGYTLGCSSRDERKRRRGRLMSNALVTLALVTLVALCLLAYLMSPRSTTRRAVEAADSAAAPRAVTEDAKQRSGERRGRSQR